MTKQELLDMVQALPDDAEFDELAAEVEKFRFKAKVRRGLDQLAQGEGIPHEEVEAMMDEWLQEE
jgi:predicted transcriptional regulator